MTASESEEKKHTDTVSGAGIATKVPEEYYSEATTAFHLVT